MFKRIAIAVGIFAPLCVAAAILYVDWKEDSERGLVGPAAVAYGIDREGRRLADRAKTAADFDKAEKKYLEALRMFRKIGRKNGEAEVLNDLGVLYDHRRRFVEAEAAYKKALKIKRETKWHWGEGNTLVNLAMLYSSLRKYGKAAKCYEEAVEAYKKSRHDKTAAETLLRLAAMYRDRRSFRKAEQCLNRVKVMAENLKDPMLKARALNGLGLLYNAMSEPSKAADYLAEALATARVHRNREGIANAAAGLAQVHLERREFSKALPYLEECAAVAKQSNDRKLVCWVLVSMGISYQYLRNYPEAARCYEDSLNFIGKEDLKTRLRVLNSLTRIHVVQGNFPKAAEHGMKLLELVRKSPLADAEESVRDNLTST